ncbi:MAG: ParB/RepB/Spo0J family partition protein [Phycisphaerae bacterium]
MSARKHPQPIGRRLALADLIARRDRATVLPRRARKALGEHISRHGCYPALIVRPHPRRAGKFEILDGHHRAEILRSLGAKTARCEVWPIDSDDASVVAATLNRLRGRQDVKRHAGQVGRLVRRFGPEGAAARLGITPRALRQQLAPADEPRRREPPPALDLQAVVFHLSAEETRKLSETLDNAGRRTIGRAKALMKAIGTGPMRPGDLANAQGEDAAR